MYIPYKHDNLRIDPLAIEKSMEATIREYMETATADMHAAMVPWVDVANRVLEIRLKAHPEWKPHWHWYPRGRVVIFTQLNRHESFADLAEIYDLISGHVEQVGPAYREKNVVARPDPVDDVDTRDRKWTWEIGWRTLALQVGFVSSKFCRIVSDGHEVVEKRRIVCSDVATLGDAL